MNPFYTEPMKVPWQLNKLFKIINTCTSIKEMQTFNILRLFFLTPNALSLYNLLVI